MIKSNQLRISELNSWDEHAEKVIDIIAEASSLFYSEEGIKKLEEQFSIENGENIELKLNRVLYFFLCRANRLLDKQKKSGKKRSLPTLPYHNIPKQPNPCEKAKEATKRERKIPDITWGYADLTIAEDNIDDSYKGNRDFIIECKRLGSPTNNTNSWKYNEKYVTEGIKRFITDEHRYGENELSSAMVGYIEDMEFDNILTEVNQTINAHLKIENLTKISEWQEKSTTKLRHKFERPFQISPFELHHFWIDLRGYYPRTISKKQVS